MLTRPPNVSLKMLAARSLGYFEWSPMGSPQLLLRAKPAEAGPSYANLPAVQVLWQAGALEGYPPVAKSAGASSFLHKNDSATLTHSSTDRARGLLRRRIKCGTVRPYPVLLRAHPVEPRGQARGTSTSAPPWGDIPAKSWAFIHGQGRGLLLPG